MRLLRKLTKLLKQRNNTQGPGPCPLGVPAMRGFTCFQTHPWAWSSGEYGGRQNYVIFLPRAGRCFWTLLAL